MKNRIYATLAAFVVALAVMYGGVNVGGPNTNTTPGARKEFPTVNLPLVLRQANWLGNLREGSCVHAAFVDLLIWQGRPITAAAWRRTHGNGENWVHLAQECDRWGIRFAQVTNGDVKFLEWACNTRRGCAITVMGGEHMVCLVHFDENWAGILDSNDISKIIWVPRETLVAEWQNSYGWAVTPVYSPSPPLSN